MNPRILLGLCLLFTACGPINTFEKNVPVPQHQWESSFKPTISFEVTDTVNAHNVYFVVRHKNAYGYNNIWVRVTVQQPADTATRSQQYDIKLANDEKGWFGRGMDDIFEHRVLLFTTRFNRAGTYTFKLEHTMREDPLKHVMNVGMRVERQSFE